MRLPCKLCLLTKKDSERFFMVLFGIGSNLIVVEAVAWEHQSTCYKYIFVFTNDSLLKHFHMHFLLRFKNLRSRTLEIHSYDLVSWRGWGSVGGEGSASGRWRRKCVKKSANLYVIGISSSHFRKEIGWGKRTVNMSMYICSNLIFTEDKKMR